METEKSESPPVAVGTAGGTSLKEPLVSETEKGTSLIFGMRKDGQRKQSDN
jgi:hypothetical protein